MKEKKKINWKEKTIAIIVIIALLWFAGNFIWQTGCSWLIDTEIASRYGTFVGGILSFISVVLIYMTLKNQQKFEEKQQQIDLHNEFNRRFDFAFEYNKWIKMEKDSGKEIIGYEVMKFYLINLTNCKLVIKEDIKKHLENIIKGHYNQFHYFIVLVLGIYNFNSNNFTNESSAYNKFKIDSNIDINFKQLVLLFKYYLEHEESKKLFTFIEFSDKDKEDIKEHPLLKCIF